MNYFLTMLMLMLIFLNVVTFTLSKVVSHDYGDALSKSILFFEGQRSGKLPSTQRLTWRKDSALLDGFANGVDLTGGYYDGGDNVKFNFPMAFTTTILSWGMLEYGQSMGTVDAANALEAIRWSTDYLLKSTNIPGVVFAQVGDSFADHSCWERPEDMDIPRTAFAVNKTSPGSEVSSEIAAALASSSMVFKAFGDIAYSNILLQRAVTVFEFADTYRGSYNDSIGYAVCPFYCDYNGYQDELLWAATWLHKATNNSIYWKYVIQNIETFKAQFEANLLTFGWDGKHAGINILLSKYVIDNKLEATTPFLSNADKFVCGVLPESPSTTCSYSPGGLLVKVGAMCNLQHLALSFGLLTYAQYIKDTNRVIKCGQVNVTPQRLIQFAKSQVDYVLGDNPMNMSYMVGYGSKFPERIHHRGSSSPSIVQHPQQIKCKEGKVYLQSKEPNPNLLIGAIPGGPGIDDIYLDDRVDDKKSEPTTYVNAPFVGLLAYFKGQSNSTSKL